MARRKRAAEDHENTERWLVSYADFITLLFAFFIVMYAVSSVNEGKYRVISQYLEAAFSESPKSLKPIQLGEVERSNKPIPLSSPAPESAASAKPVEDPTDRAAAEAELASMTQITDRLANTLSTYIDQNLIAVKREDIWIQIELKSGILFESGVATLSQDALPILMKIAEVLRDAPNTMQVEGHTDNVPIQNPQYPSNWELSAARAASVVRQFAAYGVNPEKMAAVGYGEFQPVADNLAAEGRYKNRRVVLVLMSQNTARRKIGGKDGVRLMAP
jgi:chemotaxis protein MotB